MNSTRSDIIESSAWGALRGVAVETMIYPLEVVKIHQQCSQVSQTSLQIARQIFAQGGPSAFYKGLLPQLAKTGIKQAWCWPMICNVPDSLHPLGLGKTTEQIITGILIGAVDGCITTPLEKAKILSALRGNEPFSFAHVYNNGWQGLSEYFAKRSINMATFLSAQQYFRERYRKQHCELSFSHLVQIGAQVAVVVSLVSAPFDMLNTLRQAQNLSLASLVAQNRIFTLYRGSPLNALALVIHNVASVIVIEELSKNKN